jgi:cell fate regulator YaaT (PSP1 superfamily)
LPILPLPQFESDLKEHLAEEDRKAYEALKVPKTLVVRFGSMKLVGEFQHVGTAKPGCGSKVVVRTFRGVELGEMLTSTCPNSGCSKSVSRQEMLQYIDNSGGRDYPFFTEGKVLRIATQEDLDLQAQIEQAKHELKIHARTIVSRIHPTLKVIEVEPILGGETLTVYVMTEERIELRDIGRELGHYFKARVEIRAVGARDEARLTADYEKCGQYCCCKNFLKVLKPVSMKSAKVQKATLDPLKISGRCGRLMCCLRYEDQTYEDLSKRLPRKKSRVGTPEGDGTVVDSQILTQLVLVLLDAPGEDGKDRTAAIAVEDRARHRPRMATTARPAPRAATTEQAARAKTAPTAARDPMRDLNRAPMLAPMPDRIHASSVRRAMIAPRAPMARARTLPAHPATTAPRARRNSLKRLARPATKSTTSSWATTSSTTPRAAAPKAARRLVMATVAAVAADAAVGEVAVGDRNRAELGRQTHHDLNHVMRRLYSEACVR